MFDPERLLKQMLGGALGGALGGGKGRKKHARGGLGGALGGLSTGNKAALGLGALGVAMAAWDHYKGQSKAAMPSSTLVAPPQPAFPPPPPPPPPASPSLAAPAAQTTPMASTQRVPEALLAIRSMIAAAAADGLIDGNEREVILDRAQTAGLDPDDLAALRSELAQPLSMPELLAQTPAHLAAEVYAAALITISIDTEAERRWMQRLAEGLNLDDAQRAELDAQFAPTSQP